MREELNQWDLACGLALSAELLGVSRGLFSRCKRYLFDQPAEIHLRRRLFSPAEVPVRAEAAETIGKPSPLQCDLQVWNSYPGPGIRSRA